MHACTVHCVFALHACTVAAHWELSWEVEKLKQRQIKYAANDVLTVMAILLKIVAEKHCSSDQDFQDLLRTAYDLCSQYTDVPYTDKAPKLKKE